MYERKLALDASNFSQENKCIFSIFIAIITSEFAYCLSVVQPLISDTGTRGGRLGCGSARGSGPAPAYCSCSPILPIDLVSYMWKFLYMERYYLETGRASLAGSS
ncbi:hypothetical protein EVAR_97463_1 [Eumeta japonica]|uniref:Uncharacterized protein n=1 Tax=Eumeta variegata TaxID=151549 RepID=A0A4C1WXF1_EUMVA|nr:hypothetical protein EVAR_97463_1 [Eumeta japonica]